MLKVYTGVYAGKAAKTLQGVCKTWREVNVIRQRFGVLDAKVAKENVTTYVYDINDNFVSVP